MSSMSVTAIIPAYRAAATIANTIRACKTIPNVSEIIVVDDGSTDGTSDAANAAGADTVIILPANRGKGAALAAGVTAAAHERLLFLDADLGASAAQAGPLLDVASGGTRMSIGILPKRPGSGGFGLAMALARTTTRLLGGLDLVAPMSGQRALTASLVKHVGLAPRFGVEVALNVESSLAGVEVVEVPLPLDHSHTSRTLSGFSHRARQFADILRYLLLAGFGLAWPSLSKTSAAARTAFTACFLVAVIALGALASPPAAGTIALAAAASILLWLPILWATAEWLHLRCPNYLGRSLPAAAGLLFPLIGLAAVWLFPLDSHLQAASVLTLAAFGALGLIDDLFGRASQARGLRGHLDALVKGRPTTGALKAFGGLVAGVGVGLLLDPGRPALIAVDALLVALAANLLNLLDLRPGRALKGFGLLCLPSIILGPNSLHLLGPLLAAAVISGPSDFSGRSMMGDVGANVLGAAAGLALVASLAPTARVAAVLVLLAIHLLCERVSLTDLMARHAGLRFIDQIGTTHLAPLPLTRNGIPR
jgi:UDP-N-acetylmuramyl pentapeptide phosphotransferase/UDP-N-acetylglucosamine-1-phosphate transferase